ncbi:MAG: integrase [Pelagerythrobacter marensis]|nr:MAG: integrase [Pelagerythrobacter marensis]
MLTDKAVKAAAAKDKPYKIADRQGLFLHVSPKAHKTWRYKYRFDGKEQALGLGVYPDVSLAAAREARDDARKILRSGRDPRMDKARRKLVGGRDERQTFEAVARDWYEQQLPRWKPVHANDVITSLERDVFPHIGALELGEIDEPVLLAVLRKIEARGAIETARRLKQRVGSVFVYARGLGIKVDNPAVAVGAALKPVPPAKRYPALIKVEEVRQLVHDVDRAGASPVTRMAARVLALTAQRPGMVRRMTWKQLSGIDWKDASASSPEALWTIPADEMKLELHLRDDEAFEHCVPLAPEAVATLRGVRWLTGRSPYVFPSSVSGLTPMSENAIGYLYNREGYKGRHVPHGWRSSFSTIMNELTERELGNDIRLFADRMIIDLMLAHSPKGLSASELRYNRAAFMPRRRELAERWASMIMVDALPVDEIVHSPRRKRRT